MNSGTQAKRLPKYDAPAELWEIETKVNAIAQVLQAYNSEIQAEEMDFYGLGMIVRDLANDLSEVRNQIEVRNPDFGTDLKSKGTKNK